MSQFSTMTTSERKMQAAAICREIQRPEDAEMDLGKKMSVPKDVMLEELSLASNRGSLLFEKRKRRSEKYTFESIQNVANTQINNGVTLQTQSQETTESNSLGVEQSRTPPNTPDPSNTPNPDNIAPGNVQSISCVHHSLSSENHQEENGARIMLNLLIQHRQHNMDTSLADEHMETVCDAILGTYDYATTLRGSRRRSYGGPLKQMEPEKFNSTCLPKSYHSPWDQAIYHSDPSLADSLVNHLPEPEAKPEGPGYKSFNRVATPFGGFGGKSTIPAPLFKTPDVEHNPMSELYPELQGEPAVQRPTFNRVPCGWAGANVPLILPKMHLDPMFIPESDDL